MWAAARRVARGLLLHSLAGLLHGATGWRECSLANDGHAYPSAFGPFAITVERANASFPTYRPADLTAAARWPALVFMHGSGSDDRFLSPSLGRWASHGFIVVAPLMGDEDECKKPLEDESCSDHSEHGRFILAAVQWLAEMNGEPGSALHGRVDIEALAIGGWSMGGVSAIKALAVMPPGLVRAVVLDSPSVEGCELLYNYSEAEIQADWRSARNRTRARISCTSRPRTFCRRRPCSSSAPRRKAKASTRSTKRSTARRNLPF